MSRFLPILLLFGGFFSCKTIPFTPEDSKEDYIRFGNGGGFTGAVNAYYLTRNGHLYKDEGDLPKKIGQVDAKTSKQMFSLPEILQMDKNPYDLPGNRYFFIEYKNAGKKQKITWGGDANHPTTYETWYHNLMFLTKEENLKK